MKKVALFLVCVMVMGFKPSESVAPSLKLALVKYGGGGDWYANPTALTNLANFCNQTLGTNFDNNYATVDIGSIDIYNFPFLHMTGHGNVVFSDNDAENLRNYLISGGFLHIDDNFGMDKYLRPSLKKVFPELELIELPFTHEIYNQKYTFKNGPPKIHKHEDESAQGFALIWEGRVVCFYTFESDIGDGWEDEEVHKDPVELRLKALQMGANIIQYAFSF